MFGISMCLLVYSTSTTHTLGKWLGLIFIPPITRSAKERQRKELKYMIKTFQCSNGTTYATADKTMVLVDEVIAFLEEHRGKMFWNGAVGETSFCVNSEIVTCDELQYQLAAIEDGDYAEYISDFFYGNEETGDDSDYPGHIPMDN